MGVKTALLDIIEWILTAGCKGFVGMVRILEQIVNFLGEIFKFVLILIGMLALFDWIGGLPIFWQSLVLNVLLFGSMLMFVSIIGLRLWMPEKFFEIFNKIATQK